MPSRRVHDLALRIAVQVNKRAATGAASVAIFFAARLKEIVSTPAPRKRVKDRSGNISYRATVRAISGAPPRKLSGKLRQGITYSLQGGSGRKATGAVVGVKARSERGYNYPRHLEDTDHSFVAPTVRKYRVEMNTIMGRAIRFRQV
jgi:hypothetical protein